MSNLRSQVSAVSASLKAIYDVHGHLTPSLVVEEARPKNSPLHPVVFDRPLKEAAEAYYLDRARDLIQSFRVTYREATESDPELRVRKYQAVRTEDGHIYKSAEDVAADPVLSSIVLADMRREWMALHRRYGHFAEFVELVRSTFGEDAA